MKKTILITLLASSTLFADALTDMAKDTAMSQVKTAAKSEAIKQISANTSVSEGTVKAVVNKVAPASSAEDQIKNSLTEKVMDSAGNSDIASAVTGGASMTDKAVDMAVEKTIGDNAMAKTAAKKAVDALVK
ncbi:MAG: Unknown protein [uncultured Sulfurovum sp.]|uniref:Uncharacterized protein n=1 Tax=uncultured Sulfurovum sp. TaxID=269237 RepID=A0A6S6THH8_9BACT|nr:MAG: Unknown protein [uncultured Sulfurovum sp.]